MSKFDFIKKHRSHYANRQGKGGKGPAAAKVQGNFDQLVHNDKSVEQMTKQMKHVTVRRNDSVIDYNSHGTIFYMLMHGKALCKVPTHNQVIELNDYEKALFQIQYKDDIISFGNCFKDKS